MTTKLRTRFLTASVATLAVAALITPLAAQKEKKGLEEQTPGPTIVRPLPRNPVDAVTFARIVKAPIAEPNNWLTYYGDYGGQRFSRLDQINTKNVSNLKEAWTAEFPIEKHGFECTPLVVDGVMYITTGGNTSVYCLDAKTGREYWHFRHNVPPNLAVCCDWVNRGCAIADGKVFFCSLDAKLWALDAQTGKVVWMKQYGEPREGEAATVAPLVVKDMVITGISGGEYGIRGYIAAFDQDTGRELWRFHTIPGPGEPGHETWGGAPTWITGGGPTWVTGTYDPELDLLYWGTGNAAPDFNGAVRPGDNLYTASVVVLDPDTGKLKWHFQYTPHDVYDYDAVPSQILVNTRIKGKATKALLHADKNAFFYALDRTNGKFLYAKQFARQLWAKGIDPQTGRPIINPEALPEAHMKPICPSTSGATEWNHTSYSPLTNYVYIPVIEQCATYRVSQAFFQRSFPFWGGYQVYTAYGPGEVHGYMMARNASTGAEVWKKQSTWPIVAATLPTQGGLVFWAEPQGVFHATDAKTGKNLWSDKTELGIRGSAMTYKVDGKQYVALPTGWGGDVVSLLNAGRGHQLVVWSLP